MAVDLSCLPDEGPVDQPGIDCASYPGKGVAGDGGGKTGGPGP